MIRRDGTRADVTMPYVNDVDDEQGTTIFERANINRLPRQQGDSTCIAYQAEHMQNMFMLRLSGDDIHGIPKKLKKFLWAYFVRAMGDHPFVGNRRPAYVSKRQKITELLFDAVAGIRVRRGAP